MHRHSIPRIARQLSLACGLAAIGICISGIAPAKAGGSLQAVIRSNGCETLGDTRSELTAPDVPGGEKVGPNSVSSSAASSSLAPQSLDQLVANTHSIVLADDDGQLACGTIGGSLGDDGSLVVGLEERDDSGVFGIAYLIPSRSNANETSVSLFVSGPGLAKLDLSAPATAADASAVQTEADRLASWPVLSDVRELAIRPGGMIGDEVAFSGEIMTIGVATPGRVFMLGDDDQQEFEAQLQVNVVAPDGSTEYVFVGYSGDTTGMFEGTYVTVYGEVIGTQTFENAMGGGVTQPLVNAEIITVP